MIARLTIATVVAFAVLFGTQQRASADSGDFIAGGVIGALLGAAIEHDRHKKKDARNRAIYRKNTVVQSRGTVRYSAASQHTRELQTSLNYFNFPAGSPDGVMGRRTRTGMSGYQTYLGHPVTAQLTDFEKTILLNSYHQALAGGSQISQIIANSPEGRRAVLLHTRTVLMGGQPSLGSSTVQPTAELENSTTNANTIISVPLFGSAGVEPSMATHCSVVSLRTYRNGGVTTRKTLSDATFALNEQFCLARMTAIAQGDELAKKSTGGASVLEMRQQCETLGSIFETQIVALSQKRRTEVTNEMTELVLSTGAGAAELSNTARICLGEGYRADNAQLALASTLILVALGENAYGELAAHHLLGGFGTIRRPDLAQEWYGSAVDALKDGQMAVFAPDLPDRPELIQDAATILAES